MKETNERKVCAIHPQGVGGVLSNISTSKTLRQQLSLDYLALLLDKVTFQDIGRVVMDVCPVLNYVLTSRRT